MSGTMLWSHNCHYNKELIHGPNDQPSNTGYLLLKVPHREVTVIEPSLAVLALSSVSELV